MVLLLAKIYFSDKVLLWVTHQLVTLLRVGDFNNISSGVRCRVWDHHCTAIVKYTLLAH